MNGTSYFNSERSCHYHRNKESIPFLLLFMIRFGMRSISWNSYLPKFNISEFRYLRNTTRFRCESVCIIWDRKNTLRIKVNMYLQCGWHNFISRLRLRWITRCVIGKIIESNDVNSSCFYPIQFDVPLIFYWKEIIDGWYVWETHFLVFQRRWRNGQAIFVMTRICRLFQFINKTIWWL